jgi:hypothetical protein
MLQHRYRKQTSPFGSTMVAPSLNALTALAVIPAG